MGKPEQGGSGAVVAVIVVGMLLLVVVVGGATVLLGGLLFVSYDAAPQQVTIGPQPTATVDAIAFDSQRIEIDQAGEITFVGEPVSPNELRERLRGLQQEIGYVTPQLHAAPDCPSSVHAEVISICEEVLGAAPEIIVDELTSEPPGPPIAPGDAN